MVGKSHMWMYVNKKNLFQTSRNTSIPGRVQTMLVLLSRQTAIKLLSVSAQTDGPFQPPGSVGESRVSFFCHPGADKNI